MSVFLSSYNQLAGDRDKSNFFAHWFPLIRADLKKEEPVLPPATIAQEMSSPVQHSGLEGGTVAKRSSKENDSPLSNPRKRQKTAGEGLSSGDTDPEFSV